MQRGREHALKTLSLSLGELSSFVLLLHRSWVSVQAGLKDHYRDA